MRSVRVWLATVFGFIFAMVVVGGITRLTGSGLSMVEWHPLMGAVPPLDESSWRAVFESYKATPQYELVNHWMELEDFKRIFFWEYVHRLLGRLLGLVFIVPWLVFIARGVLRGRLLRVTGIALVLGAAQGVLGWIMVMSGLVDRPSVSHYRLAAHLSLALIVAQWVFWILLDLHPKKREADGRASRGFRRGVVITMALLALQIVYGAFMAGTRAGLMSATFPDMNGQYGPGAFVHEVGDLVSNPLAIHWVHRTLAWAVGIGFGCLTWMSRRESRFVRVAVWTASGTAVLQIVLGALTVIHHVPVLIAVLHQALAFVLLTATVWLAYRAQVFCGAASPAKAKPQRQDSQSP